VLNFPRPTGPASAAQGRTHNGFTESADERGGVDRMSILAASEELKEDETAAPDPPASACREVREIDRKQLQLTKGLGVWTCVCV
jgi:hypothetical protein